MEFIDDDPDDDPDDDHGGPPPGGQVCLVDPVFGHGMRDVVGGPSASSGSGGGGGPSASSGSGGGASSSRLPLSGGGDGHWVSAGSGANDGSDGGNGEGKSIQPRPDVFGACVGGVIEELLRFHAFDFLKSVSKSQRLDSDVIEPCVFSVGPVRPGSCSIFFDNLNSSTDPEPKQQTDVFQFQSEEPERVEVFASVLDSDSEADRGLLFFYHRRA